MGWMTTAAFLALVLGASAPLETAAPAPVEEEAAAPADAASGSFAEDRAAAVAALVADLEELADWCNSEKLFLERDRVYELVLEFEPDHAGARKVLKYRRDRDGQWERSDSYREPVNRGKTDLAEVAARRREVGARFSEAIHGLLSEHRDDVARTDVEAAHADVLRVDPDDPATRAARGEVLDGEAWVLVETARGRTRRVELRTLVQDALNGAPEPKSAPVSPAERALGVEWSHVVETEDVRALTTGERVEVVRVAQVNHAAGEVFRGVFGAETQLYDDYTIYLLVHGGEKEAFLERHPAVAPEQRESLMALVGSGIPGTANVAQWQDDPAARLDGIVRHTLGGLLRDEYGISIQHGWVWEGVGIYLTWRMLGTRLTWYVQPDDYQLDDGMSLRPLLHVPGSNWTNEAYKLLRSKRRPDLREVLGRTVTELRVQDMLVAYALAAYLLEGRPDEAPELLRRVGEGQEPDVAVREALGLSLDDLPDRLVRWLSERR